MFELEEIIRQNMLSDLEKATMKKIVYQSLDYRFLDFNKGSQSADNHSFGNGGGVAMVERSASILLSAQGSPHKSELVYRASIGATPVPTIGACLVHTAWPVVCGGSRKTCSPRHARISLLEESGESCARCHHPVGARKC